MCASVTHPPLLSSCLSDSEHQTPRTEPTTVDLQAQLLDEESQITMENIVDDTLKLHSASDVRVLDALCLSVAIDEYVYTLHSLSLYTIYVCMHCRP